MIIILSPAKTFNRTTNPYDTTPVFASDADFLVSQLKRVSIKKLMSTMQISKTIAEKTKLDYAQFNQIKTAAIHGYNGHQFKNFDVTSLEQKGLKNHIKSIYILSGLYGLVNAYDGISPYRLEMKNKTIKNLYTYWQPKLEDYITNHFKHETIYNLASEEYGKLIKHIEGVVTIQFLNEKDNKLSIHSMEAKRMRGLFARYLMMYPHVDLKGIKLEGYMFSIKHSTSTLFTYIKAEL